VLCTAVDKHVLYKVKALNVAKTQREQPIGKRHVCRLSFPALPLWVLRSLSSRPLHLLLGKLPTAKGTLMSRTVILLQISGALCEFPNLIFSIPQASTLRCSFSVSVFAESFSGIYCSLLPLGCWSADSQRVVFDSVQRSRQVKAPDCVRR
jgi:hypothetical protein